MFSGVMLTEHEAGGYAVINGAAAATGFAGATLTNIAVSSPGGTIVGAAGSKFAGMEAKEAYVTCETATAYYTMDGTTPNAGSNPTVGHLLAIGGSVRLLGPNAIKQFLAINGGGGTLLKATFFF